jgi:DNA polymerase-4
MDTKQSRGRTLTLKLKYGDYQQVTRSRTLTEPIDELHEILDIATELLSLTEVEHKPVRLLGLALSNLGEEIVEEYVQLSLGFSCSP